MTWPLIIFWLNKVGCVSLNLTDEAGYTLIPDGSDSMTSVVDALKVIRDTFGPSPGAG